MVDLKSTELAHPGSSPGLDTNWLDGGMVYTQV